MQPTDIVDLVRACLNKMQTDKFVDVSMPLRRYLAMTFLKYAKIVNNKGQDPYKWDVKFDIVDTAKTVGMYEEVSYAFGDNHQYAQLPTRMHMATAIYDTKELMFNADSDSDHVVATKVFDLLEDRKNDGNKSLHKLFESQVFGAPTDENDDSVMHGLMYHLTKPADVSSGTSGGAYNCPNPSGFTTYQGLTRVGRLDRWGNYGFWWTTFTVDQFKDALDDAMEKTKWESPVSTPDMVTDTSLRFVSVYAVEKQIKRLSELQNDQLGFDIDPANGKASYRRIPMMTVPRLEYQADGVTANTDYPFLCLDLASFFVLSPDGLSIKMEADSQHIDRMPTVFPIHFYINANLGCWSPRNNAYGYSIA